MKILFSLLLLVSLPAKAACRFSANSVYSLSGPMSAVLEELGLLSSPVVKGLTVFYPRPGNFKGEIIPGGVHLAPAKLEAMKHSLIFFDTSTELKKLLHSKKMNAVEINSRSLSPRQVTTRLWEVLRPYVQDCENEKIKMFERLEMLEKKIKEKMKVTIPVVVFLGKVGEGKLPELVISNDGVVKWMREEKLIKSYPSELAYVNWAASIMNELNNYSLVGFQEAKAPSVSGDGQRTTLSYPGVLVPGILQLEAWNYFLDRKEGRK